MGMRGFLDAIPALLVEIDRACRAPMITEKMQAGFDHAMRGPLTVILGEIELVLSDADISAKERGRSIESAIGRYARQSRCSSSGGGRPGVRRDELCDGGGGRFPASPVGRPADLGPA